MADREEETKQVTTNARQVIFWEDTEPADPLETAIRSAAQEVMNVLGNSHSEAVYQKALETELRLRKIGYESKPVYSVIYKDYVVGHHEPDLVVNHEIIVELKAYGSANNGKAQLERYLKQGTYKKGILINFSRKPVSFLVLLKS